MSRRMKFWVSLDERWSLENGGTMDANSDPRIGTRRTFPGGAAKKATLTMDGFTRGNTPDQIFQTPSSARRARGQSGPRIGADGTSGCGTSVTGHGGKHTSNVANQKETGNRRIGDEGLVASGSFFTSMQQESPFSDDPQSGQHLTLPLEVSPKVANPGARTLFSSRHTRIGAAAVGIMIPKQISRKVASTCRTDGYFVPPERRVKAIIPIQARSFIPRKRSALEMTETDDSDIAAPAIIGLSRVPVIG